MSGRKFSLWLIPCLGFGLLLAQVAQANELYRLYRGFRATAMGGAYVGLADDEQALYLNPAGLAGLKNYSLHYAVADVAVSGDTVFGFDETANAFADFSTDSINAIMDKDIFAEVQITPSLTMPNFGVGLLIDQELALYTKNKALPQITVGYQTTNGVQFGYGVSILKAARNRAELRVGVGGKIMWRRGGYKKVPFIKLLAPSQELLKELTGNFGQAIGGDLGSQFIYSFDKRMKASLGTSYTEIGDLNFGDGPEHQKGNLSFGAAFQYEVSKLKAIIAYDYAHVLAKTDWRKKNHLGVELAIPFISVYGGINQVFLTYGGSVDLWLIRFTALSYAEEVGSYVHVDPQRRYMMKVAFKFDL